MEICAKTGEIRDCLDQNGLLFASWVILQFPFLIIQRMQIFIEKTGIEGIVLTGGNDFAQ